MKINEIIVESQQLDEGPLGKAIGRGFGKAVQGVGAVAGGLAAAPSAFKKGFDAGKKTVSSVSRPSKPAAKTTPTKKAAAKTTQTAPADTKDTQLNLPSASKTGFLKAIDQLSGRDDFTSDIDKQKADTVKAAKAGVKATSSAKPVAKTTLDSTQSAYLQAKANIEKLDKKGKQRLLNLLQKSLAQHSTRPTAKPTV